MDGLLDSVMLVDLLRNFSPALTWRNANPHLVLAVTSFVWLEIVVGARNKADQNSAVRLLNNFQLNYPTTSDLQWAMNQVRQLHLSHNVGMMDCLIAASAHRLQLSLFTRNLKRLTPQLGTLAQQPYT